MHGTSELKPEVNLSSLLKLFVEKHIIAYSSSDKSSE